MNSSTKNEVLGAIWNSVNSMRGLIEIGEARNLVLGLLVLKKMLETESSSIINWNEIASKNFNIGISLNEAFHQIYQKKPELRECLLHFDFNSDRIGGREIRDTLWKNVMAALSQIDLDRMEKTSPGAICQLDIKLNEWFANASGQKGSYETPACVINLLTELLNPPDGSTVFDPFCSSGSTIIGASCHVSENKPGTRIKLYGQTSDKNSLSTIWMNLLLTNNDHAQIKLGDVIRQPGFINKTGKLMTFNRILCTIPYGIKNWGEEIAQSDNFFRFTYGIPPRTQGEYGYLQHCIASLSEDGILACVIHPSMLFRERSEGDIRKRMINHDIIEAVIALPNKLYSQTGIALAILIINRHKPAERKNKILFVNAKNDFLAGRSQNKLRDEDRKKIGTVYRNFDEEEGYSRVCSIDDIAINGFQLDVSQYVKEKRDSIPTLDMDEAVKDLEKIQKEKSTAYEKMTASLMRFMEYRRMK